MDEVTIEVERKPHMIKYHSEKHWGVVEQRDSKDMVLVNGRLAGWVYRYIEGHPPEHNKHAEKFHPLSGFPQAWCKIVDEKLKLEFESLRAPVPHQTIDPVDPNEMDGDDV